MHHVSTGKDTGKGLEDEGKVSPELAGQLEAVQRVTVQGQSASSVP